MALKIVVFYGSARSERRGILAARFAVGQCRERGHDVSLIEPQTHPLPLLDKMYSEYEPGQAPEVLRRMAEVIIPADAYVVVSGEYNHNVPPGLANLMDHFLKEYFRKPSAIVCYSAGRFGGVRASIALRSMLGEMGTSSIPSVLPIPYVQKAFEDDGTAKDPKLVERARDLWEELEWYAYALREARNRPCPRAVCAAASPEPPADERT